MATIEYDLFNRMVKYEKGTDVYTYTYNGDGQRMSKTANGVTTYFVWDGMDMILEHVDYFNNTGYYYGPDGVEFQQYSDGLHLAAAYVKNALGDVVGTYDVMSGVTLYQEYCYDAYGNPVEEYDFTDTTPPSENPFRYRGEYYDTETGFYYLRNRYYDPKAGRFITEDPIRDGTNWYTYCAGNPVEYHDTNGLHRQPINETVNDQTVTTAEREDLRELLKQTNGVLKIEGNIIKIKALGGYGEINMDSYNDGIHNVNDHLHFSYGEFFELLGLDYEKTAITVQVSQSEENKNRLSYAFKSAGKNLVKDVLIKPVNLVFGTLSSILGKVNGFMDDLSVDSNATPPIIPKGNYQINEYKVAGKVTIQQRIGTSSGNNYYKSEFIYWNPENPSYITDTFNGWETP